MIDERFEKALKDGIWIKGETGPIDCRDKKPSLAFCPIEKCFVLWYLARDYTINDFGTLWGLKEEDLL